MGEDTDMAVMVITLESDLPRLTAITEEFFLEDTDMAVMVITLESDLLKLTVITEEFFLEDTDMAATVITSERDLLKLTATMEEFLEGTVMVDTVDTSSENRCILFFIFLSI